MYRLRKEDNSIIHKVYGNGVDILEELDTVTFAKNAAKREKAAALTDPAKRAEYIAKEIERLQAEKVAIDAKIEALQETLQELQATELEWKLKRDHKMVPFLFLLTTNLAIISYNLVIIN